MPELPEVEVVRRGLDAHVVGRRIDAVTVTGARVTRRHPAGPEDLAARLTGRQVHAADRRGKYLWLVLGDAPGRGGDAGSALVVHLGMSGQLLVRDPAVGPERHLHARLDLGPRQAPGSAPVQLRFVDQRTFGGLVLSALAPDPAGQADRGDRRAEHADGVPGLLAHIAPDPLEEAFDGQRLVRSVTRSDRAIKRLLLDQQVVSGIGNIYADEALWRSGIHGERPGSALTGPRVARLVGHVREVMGEALDQGGTSFDSLYVDVDGARGYFDRSLQAYGRQGRPCARCGTPIRRDAFMNRSSFSCPRCQPAPRKR